MPTFLVVASDGLYIDTWEVEQRDAEAVRMGILLELETEGFKDSEIDYDRFKIYEVADKHTGLEGDEVDEARDKGLMFRHERWKQQAADEEARRERVEYERLKQKFEAAE